MAVSEVRGDRKKMRQGLHGRIFYVPFNKDLVWVGHEEPLQNNFVGNWELF